MKNKKLLIIAPVLLLSGSLFGCGGGSSDVTLTAELKTAKTFLTGDVLSKDDIKVTLTAKDGKTTDVTNFTVDGLTNDKYTFVHDDGKPDNRSKEFEVKANNKTTKLKVNTFNGEVTKDEFSNAYDLVSKIGSSSNYSLKYTYFDNKGEVVSLHNYEVEGTTVRKSRTRSGEESLTFQQLLEDYNFVASYDKDSFDGFEIEYDILSNECIGLFDGIVDKFSSESFNLNNKCYTIELTMGSEESYKMKFDVYLNSDIKYEKIDAFMKNGSDFEKAITYEFNYGNAKITDMPERIVISNTDGKVEGDILKFETNTSFELKDSEYAYYGIKLGDNRISKEDSPKLFLLDDKGKVITGTNDLIISYRFNNGEDDGSASDSFSYNSSTGEYKIEEESDLEKLEKAKSLIIEFYNNGSTPVTINGFTFSGTKLK